MAGLDYYAIESKVRDVLAADPTLSGAVIQVESELSAVECPTVVIYLDRRDAPADMQSVSSGTRTRYLITLSIWCLDVNLEGLAEASRARDALLDKVEVALMKNRDLDGLVAGSWFEGGEFVSAAAGASAGFVSAGEIVMTVDATSVRE